MAQNFLNDVLEPQDFCPYDPPYAMNSYNFNDLTEEQKRALIAHKVKKLREDHIYLKKHPEIKKVLSLLYRAILKSRPINVYEFLDQFVNDNLKLLSDIIFSESIRSASITEEVPSVRDDSPLWSPKISDTSSIYTELNMTFSDDEIIPSVFSDTKSVDEARAVCSEVINDLLNEVCTEDIVSQFKKCFASDARKSNAYDSLHLIENVMPDFDVRTSIFDQCIIDYKSN